MLAVLRDLAYVGESPIDAFFDLSIQATGRSEKSAVPSFSVIDVDRGVLFDVQERHTRLVPDEARRSRSGVVDSD